MIFDYVGQTRFSVGAAKGRMVGLAKRIDSIGARCVRKSFFVRGCPPKTGVGEGANPFRPVSAI